MNRTPMNRTRVLLLLLLAGACEGVAPSPPALPDVVLPAVVAACPSAGRECPTSAEPREARRAGVQVYREAAYRAFRRAGKHRVALLWGQRHAVTAASVAVYVVYTIASTDNRALDDRELVEAEGRYQMLDDEFFRTRFDDLLHGRLEP